MNDFVTGMIVGGGIAALIHYLNMIWLSHRATRLKQLEAACTFEFLERLKDADVVKKQEAADKA